MNYLVAYCTSPSSDCESDDIDIADDGNTGDGAVNLFLMQQQQSIQVPTFCSRLKLRHQFKLHRLRWDLNDWNYFLYSQLLPVWALWLVRICLTIAYLVTLIYVCVTSATVAIEAASDEVPNPFDDWLSNPSVANTSANSISAAQKRHHFIAYLTYWNFLVTCIYLTGSSVVMLVVKTTDGDSYLIKDGPYLVAWSHQTKRRPITRVAAWLAANCLWLAMHVSYTGSLLVTGIGLWHSLLRPTYARLFMHGCNSLLMTADALASGLTFRLAYLFYVELSGFVYLAFSAIYWSFDPAGNVLYPGLLDWNSPTWTAAVSCIVAVVCTPSLHCLCWLLAGPVRDWLGRKKRLEQLKNKRIEGYKQLQQEYQQQQQQQQQQEY